MDRQQITEAAKAIAAGGVVAYPTESCYGLGCDPDCTTAIEKILKLKQRSRDKGLILIADQWHKLSGYLLPMDQQIETRMMASWPGPVTWLCPCSSDVSVWLKGVHDTLAVRVTAHPVAAELSRAVDTALVSTSANIARQPALHNAKDVEHTFGGELDYILDAAIGGDSSPSTIIDAISGNVIRP